MAKRYVDSIPRSRYMSVTMGQLAVADCREIFPGDYVRHRCRIGVHLSPMQAPELAPMIIKQDTFFVANRCSWDYWDNYISQKLLDETTVGPFDENKLLPPQVAIFLGSGYNQSDGRSRHLDNVRGVYDLLEGLGMKLSYTDTVARNSASVDAHTGSVLLFNAFPLMGYWSIWHHYYRDAYLQNDSFVAESTSRTPIPGDPWADEQPVPDSDATVNADRNWNSPFVSMPIFASRTTLAGKNLPGVCVSPGNAQYSPNSNYRGVFSFAKRHPAVGLGVLGNNADEAGSYILPGACVSICADRGSYQPSDGSIVPPLNSIGMYAPVCMPKDYIFSARQSPVYNEDVAVPGTVRDLRKAFQVLGYREKVLRFDNRIKAWLWNMWHVNISDKRLNQPIWLGGAQSVINTQEILGTVNNTDTVLGQLGGFGVGAVRGRWRKFRSEDHGFLYTVFYISVLPVYGDGVQRYWYRGSLLPGSRQPFADGPLDWPLPDFARIGQQQIYRGEVAVNPAQTVSTASDYRQGFGYADRFSDTSFMSSDVCGDFRTILRFWHTGLFFGLKDITASPTDDDLPKVSTVSGDFVSLFNRLIPNQRLSRSGTVRGSISSNLTARLFDAGVSADPFWVVVNSDFHVSRRLPAHSHPGYADHTSKVV